MNFGGISWYFFKNSGLLVEFHDVFTEIHDCWWNFMNFFYKTSRLLVEFHDILTEIHDFWWNSVIFWWNFMISLRKFMTFGDFFYKTSRLLVEFHNILTEIHDFLRLYLYFFCRRSWNPIKMFFQISPKVLIFVKISWNSTKSRELL